ncbi:DUF916 and DUF3324 domain-containing protein [Vagococcus hydrophili]|uniref:DUF916 and DUF3324 domain-containing protein n=1 Tax=Vagococcus hydrophili TaxID=2714947 RepID=A0A6G8AQY5_9ENTE|nr:DUF916 and DUF3324 domain-containing protein [Vagococcus hydrophili]QIL47352.1 DUF916 and DUF3324 domain-containing protein [Vagococcus hydrophili]
MKKNKKWLWVIIGLVLIFVTGNTSQAEESESDIGYHIQAMIPKNQLDKEKSYFDLRMKPGEKQTIEFAISNTSEEESEYEVAVNQAYTNAQGFIDYSEPKKSKLVKYAIEDIAEVEKSVKVAPRSVKKVPIKLTMPKESFDGQILSGIQVIKKGKKESSKITNSYGYVLGLKLTETDKAVKRDIKLKKIEPAVSFGKTSVVVELENPTMDSIGHLKYDVKITDEKTEETIKETTYGGDMQMAPTSSYRLAIDWDNKSLKKGNYKLHLIVSDAKDNKWEFNEKFEITSEDAKKVNDLTVTEDNQKDFPYLWIIIGVIVLVLVIGIIIYVRKKKNSANNKKSKSKKKKKKSSK